ncbi:cbb3-type cytochrome-c oxidase maturation nitrogen fixation domain-containing protein (plasmid) [Rhizobium etli]|uniref:Cbb3-type cytochrome-c oxidase maturation nitrogen fixation domain-containing protein n=1 Tax=Rhizobium etli TaxID=29449 RepID=A0AAN1BLY1_RHIET|nr:cbb3-type cytochrome-c oxidase maturation nitrogen fixation domain-containing protein [Rhizobium etli]
MNMLVYLIPLALFMGALGLNAFLWSLKSRQYGSCPFRTRPRRHIFADRALGTSVKSGVLYDELHPPAEIRCPPESGR